MTRLAPRVKPNRDGTVTISGVPYTDLRSILTAAQLYRYENEEKILATCSVDNITWDRRIKAIIKMLEPGPYVSSVQNVPLSQLQKWQIAIRWRDVKQKRDGRIRIESIMKEIFG